MILDGWGVAPANRGNAISLASTPNFDSLVASYPTMVVQASGEAVGLPWGEMGNSEVGHLNIGAGKIIYQDLPRITKAISDNSFFTRQAFLDAAHHVQKHHSQLHLAGLVSNGGIHSFNEHLYALLEFCMQEKIERVFIHAFLDGRDTPYNSAKNFLTKLQKEIDKLGVGVIVTMAGRFWAMDRDHHWDRTEKVYRAMTKGEADAMATDPIAAVTASYVQKVYDEEFAPTVVTTPDGKPLATVQQDDAIIFFNFRNDRMRQLTNAFVAESFDGFARGERVKNLFVVTMTEYEKGLPVAIAFPPEYIDDPLAKVISDHSMTQLHMAETEKYAHVTFFLNGGREEPFPGEKRILIPSPSVSSYDQKPDMGARKITDRLIEEMQTGAYDFLVVNYANADMVGHTGNLPAVIKAVEVLDECIGKVVQATLQMDGTAIITADHGNAEESLDLQTGVINKEHSNNPVPLLIIGRQWQGQATAAGRDLATLTPIGFLSDVAPTVLALLGIPQAAAMTGRTLLHPLPS